MYNKKYINLFKDKKYKYDPYRIKQSIPYNFTNLKYLNYKYYKYFFIFLIFTGKNHVFYMFYMFKPNICAEFKKKIYQLI